MPELSTIYDYMRANASLLGARILQEYPALHQFEDPVSPRIEGLLRKPFPAQTIAVHGTCEALAAGPNRHGNCRVRNGQNADFTWGNSRPQRRAAIYFFGDGSTAPGRKVGAGSVSDIAGAARVPDR